MKKTLLALLLTVGLDFGAHAGNEGPQAAPTEPQTLIAEYIVNSYFGPEHMVGTFHYQIYSEGYTQLVSEKRSGTTIKALLPYNKNDAAEIKSLVSEIRSGKLFDPEPSRPGCMDAPSITMKIYKGKRAIVIALKVACKEQDRKNRSHADEKLINILNELVSSSRS